MPQAIASPADVCNLALSLIGATDSAIQSLDTDKSQEAQVCNQHYTQALKRLLASFWWPFATRRVVLLAMANEPLRSGWQFVYGPLPNDMVAPRYIWPDVLNSVAALGAPYSPIPPTALYAITTNPRTPRIDQRIPYAIEASLQKGGDGNYLDQQVLLCDYNVTNSQGTTMTGVTFVYTSMINDLSKFPPLFIDAFAALIASRVAMPLTKKLTIKQAAFAEYKLLLGEAQAESLKSEQEDIVPDSEFISGRV